jgi:hypothetical protein
MEKHLQVLGILFIVYGVMGLIGAAIGFIVFFGAAAFGGYYLELGHWPFIANVFSLCMIMLVTLLSIPSTVAGWGILKHQSWGRIMGLVIGILILFELPFGTALGIYALWALLSEDGTKLFKPANLRTV